MLPASIGLQPDQLALSKYEDELDRDVWRNWRPQNSNALMAT
jgi:hypothetical protein